MECGDLSALSAGDLSPSSRQADTLSRWRRSLDAPWLADKPASHESGDRSPHSRVFRHVAASWQFASDKKRPGTFRAAR
jgi:hypothetical protein